MCSQQGKEVCEKYKYIWFPNKLEEQADPLGKKYILKKKKDLAVSLRCQTPLNATLLLEKIKAVFKSLAKNVLFSTN